MQETWRAGVDWNKKVPDATEQNMKKWFQELQILDPLKLIDAYEKVKSILKPIFPSIHTQMH